MLNNVRESELLELEENERYVRGNCGSNKPSVLPKALGMDKEKRGEKNSLHDVVPVSVSFCCITNCHKTLWLKTLNILLFLMSLWSTWWLFWPLPAQLGQDDLGWSLTGLVIGTLMGLAGPELW